MLKEAKGIRRRVHPRKTWWDRVKDDTNSFSQSYEDAQDKDDRRMRTKEATAIQTDDDELDNPGLRASDSLATNGAIEIRIVFVFVPEKWPLKWYKGV